MPTSIYAPPGGFIGPYEVLEPLGGGGPGAVYQVRSGGELFALKLLPFDASRATREERSRFEQRARQELEGLRALDSPYLVRVHALGWWRGGGGEFPYLVMELIEGLPWREWVAQGQLTPRRLVDALVQLSLTLARMHARGLCHRDLELDHVLVRPGGEPVLIHLGIAQGRTAVALTVADALGGGCRHLSPEFAEFFLHGWRRGARYSHLATSDLHVLGALLYLALTGVLPFAGEQGDLSRLLFRVLDVPPSHPCALNPRAPKPLGELAMRLLAQRGPERPWDGEELARDLLRALGEADASWDAPLLPSSAFAQWPREGAPRR